MSDPSDKRISWLAHVFEAALRHGIFKPTDVMAHAGADVLALHLPKELQIRILEASLTAGKMTPESILAIAPPAMLARHLPVAILWKTARDAAARHGIVAASNLSTKAGRTPLRLWLADILGAALEREVLVAADVMRHLPPGEWVRDVPMDVVSKLIAAGLNSQAFEPRLALEHLTPQVIGEFVKPHLVWAIVDEAVVRSFEIGAADGKAAEPAKASAAPAKPATPAPPTPTKAAAAEPVMGRPIIKPITGGLASGPVAAGTPSPAPPTNSAPHSATPPPPPADALKPAADPAADPAAPAAVADVVTSVVPQQETAAAAAGGDWSAESVDSWVDTSS